MPSFARRAEDQRAELLHLHFIGGAQSSLGEFETARRTLEQGIDLARTAQDCKLLSWLLNDLGGVYAALGELDQAEKCYQEAVAVVRQLGARWELGYLLVNLANAAVRKGWYEQAEELFKESMALLAQFGDRHGYSGCIFHLATFAWRRGDSVQARSLFFEGLEIERQLGRQRYIPSALERTAEFLDQNDNPYLAAILIGCAQAYRRGENYPPEAEELPRLQMIIERVRSSLSEAAYAEAFAEGERLTVQTSEDVRPVPRRPD